MKTKIKSIIVVSKSILPSHYYTYKKDIFLKKFLAFMLLLVFEHSSTIQIIFFQKNSYKMPSVFECQYSSYLKFLSRTTVSQDMQTRFLVQLAFAKFLSRIKGNF